MSGLDDLLRQVVEQARGLGIPVSPRIDPGVRINTRAKTRLGCCRVQGNSFVIELSARLLTAPLDAQRQTLAHEVLHTCYGCRNHGKRWQAYARRMNDAYGYHIRRTGSFEELGAAGPPPAPRHVLVCEACGKRFERLRESKLTRKPHLFRCRCGGRLKRLY